MGRLAYLTKENSIMTVEDSPEWEPPPPPPAPEAPPPPEMSEVGTLGNIFFEPERTFKDFRRKPRFIIAGIIIALLLTAYAWGIALRVGEQAMRAVLTEQMDKNPRADSMTPEQKSSAIDLQLKFGKYARYAIPVFIF